MAKYKVAEKFISINGEGVRAGQLAVFIRFRGCNLACSFCDTKWAIGQEGPFTEMTGEEIYTYIKNTQVKNVTLTGGEPLLQPNLMDLLLLLSQDDSLLVEIETNGSVDVKNFQEIPNPPSFTMDYKLPGSHMETHMLLSNFSLLTKEDTVKFVVGSLDDFLRAKELVTIYELTRKCHVHFSPVFGKIEPKAMVELLIEHGLNDVTLQLQLHKVIWDPDTMGV